MHYELRIHVWYNDWMKKEPTLDEAVYLLRQIESDLQRLGHRIAGFLYDYDNPVLIARILRRVQESKLKKISVSWIQRTLGCGYSKAARLMDEMEDRKFVESENSRRGTMRIIAKRSSNES